MQCPTCDRELATAEIGGIEIDFCVAHCGTWLDEGELEVLLGSPEPVLTPGPRVRAKTRRCPRCSAHMQVRQASGALELDICPGGDGIWFDRGELATLRDAWTRAKTSAELAQLAPIFERLHSLLGERP